MSEKPKAAAPVIKPKSASIYVGPTLKGNKLVRYTIFKNGELPEHVKELLNQSLDLKGLIIPVEKLGEFENNLKDISSIEALRFNRVKGL